LRSGGSDFLGFLFENARSSDSNTPQHLPSPLLYSPPPIFVYYLFSIPQLTSDMSNLYLVWQQEEWIKANITKDNDSEIPTDAAVDMGAKELAAEAVSKPELNRRSMRGLEFAQEH